MSLPLPEIYNLESGVCGSVNVWKEREECGAVLS